VRLGPLLLATALIASGAPARAEVLRFTLPRYDARVCQGSIVPLRDLALARLYGQPQWEGFRVVAEHAATVPGAADSFVVAPDERPWCYYVATVDSAGNESCWAGPVQLNGRVEVDPGRGTEASGLWLGVPRPNPSRGLIAVSFCLPEAGRALLEVRDVAGRRVARLRDGPCAAGVHVVLWDGRGAASGLYFIHARLGRWSETRRILVLH